jgi:hypothetical protein
MAPLHCGVKTTATDMIRFAQANIDPSPPAYVYAAHAILEQLVPTAK